MPGEFSDYYVWVRLTDSHPRVHTVRLGPPYDDRTGCGLSLPPHGGWQLAYHDNLHPDLPRCRRCYPKES